MADITDPIAIKFVNEHVRPLCEDVRNQYVRLIDAAAIWVDGMSDKFPNDSSPLLDGREAQGVSRLTGEDIHAVVGHMASIVAVLGAAGVMDEIRKPCVRALTIEE